MPENCRRPGGGARVRCRMALAGSALSGRHVETPQPAASQAGTSPRQVRLRCGSKHAKATQMGRGSMNSADPTDLESPNRVPRDVLHVGKSSGNAPKKISQEDADVRSEQPQPKPDTRKTDGNDPAKHPASDPTAADGPKGIKGAFRKHPVAMVVCLGLIVVGIIAGIAWYLHARHYESTDDAFIDGRPVLVSPEVSGKHYQRQRHRQSDRKRWRPARDHRPAQLQSRSRSGRRANPARRSDHKKHRCSDCGSEEPRSIRPRSR